MVKNFAIFQILHVVGSPTDEFNFTLNIFFASAFNPKRHPEFTHLWAVIRPTDRKWSFANDLNDIVDIKTKKRSSTCDVLWFDLTSSLAVIANVIKPSVIVPHLFCSQGVTAYRYIDKSLD